MEESDKNEYDQYDNSSPDEGKDKSSPLSDELERGNHSNDKLSRSKMQYEADTEDYELRKKLLESKMARKKTEEDAKILMNRLMLLKNEESKAWKKIEETKKKAEEIIKTRERNLEKQRQREERRRQKEEDEKKRAENNKLLKDQMKSKIELGKLKNQSLNQAKANMLRLEKADTLEAMEQEKQEHFLKKYNRKKEIQEKEREAIERRQQEIEERRERAKAALEEAILEEQRMRLQKEAELAKMEQEEEELIQKLKNTQLHQQAALEDLEQALTSQSEVLSDTSKEHKRITSSSSGKKPSRTSSGKKD